MNSFDFKNRQRLKIRNLLIGFSGGKSIPNKVGFQTIGKRKTLYNQAFFLIFQGRNDDGFGFNLQGFWVLGLGLGLGLGKLAP